MTRVFTFFLSILLCPIVLGCVLPIHGPEYDSLIDITKNDYDGSYHVEVPKKLKNTGAARVYLIYSKSGDRKNGVANISRELDFGFGWKAIKGDFVAPKKEGYAPYIHVVWPGEVCSTVANAKIPNGAE